MSQAVHLLFKKTPSKVMTSFFAMSIHYQLFPWIGAMTDLTRNSRMLLNLPLRGTGGILNVEQGCLGIRGPRERRVWVGTMPLRVRAGASLKNAATTPSGYWGIPALGTGQSCHWCSVHMRFAAVAFFLACSALFFFLSSIFKLYFLSGWLCKECALFPRNPITILFSMTTPFPFCRRET